MAHKSKEFESLIDVAKLNGCRIEDSGVTVKIFPSKRDLGFYTAHRSDKYHNLRRFLTNKCGFILKKV